MAQEEPEVPLEELVVPLAVVVVPAVPLVELEARLVVVCLTAWAVPLAVVLVLVLSAGLLVVCLTAWEGPPLEEVLALALSAGPAVELEWGLLGEAPAVFLPASSGVPPEQAGLLEEEVVLVPVVLAVEVVLLAALAGPRAVAEAAMTLLPAAPLVPLAAATLQMLFHFHTTQALTWRLATKLSLPAAARMATISGSRAHVPPCC